MLSQAAKRDYKRLTIDIEAEKYRRRSEALITSDEGIETRINRSIQAEGSFSLLKAAFGYRRFRTHGMRNRSCLDRDSSIALLTIPRHWNRFDDTI